MDVDFNIKNNTKRQNKEYWIDLSGGIHKFTGDLSEEYSSFHAEIAQQLHPNSNRPTDILMNLGWIMVGSTVYSNPIIYKPPTQAQITLLYDLGLYKFLLIEFNGIFINYAQNQVLFH